MVHCHCPEPTQIRIGQSPLWASTGGQIFGPEPTSGQVTLAFIFADGRENPPKLSRHAWSR